MTQDRTSGPVALRRGRHLSTSSTSPPRIEVNEQFRHALDVLEDGHRSIFITGRAGTGKSTLLNYFRQNTRKKVAVLAPTGVAALNVKGQTIHSFFRFKPGITPEQVKRQRSSDESKNIYRELDIIVIDEVSMVRADLLDCVDRFLRLNGPKANLPFGGIQMAFIGDLYQLPPVVTSAERPIFESLYKTPYFYGAHVFDSFEMELVELEKIYRQHDQEFIDLLNSIRNNSVDSEGLKLLNERCQPDFEPPADEFWVYLTTTNAVAEEVNSKRLAALKGRASTFTGLITGEFGKEYLPTAVDLRVKAGAQIMMLNNDSAGRWVNGTIGKITGILRDEDGEPFIVADLDETGEVAITPHKWEITRFLVEGGTLHSEVVGTFTQFPLMLAWAVTIHKGQGKTFRRVIIDIGSGTFAHGQMYVALSRCTTLEGIILKKPALKKHIWSNWQVMGFLTKYQYRKAEKACSVDNKMEIIFEAIKSKSLLEITYLKPSDVKSTRVVRPLSVGEMEYLGKQYTGMRAFCTLRHEERTFRVDRILEIREAPEVVTAGHRRVI